MKKYTLRTSGVTLFVGTFSSIIQEIVRRIEKKTSFTILPLSLNDLASVYENSVLDRFYKDIDICTTDGMPIVWWFRLHGIIAQRVYGPNLMESVLHKTQGRKYSHFFLGSSPETLTKLVDILQIKMGNLHIVGQLSPPFTDSVYSTREIDWFVREVKKQKTNILWIGLSSPKQVILAGSLKRALPNVSIFCVGAAFDFLSERKVSAPSFLQRAGLEWLFRLSLEPKRLWRRYLVNIPKYIVMYVVWKKNEH